VYTAGSDSALRHWDIDGDRRFIAQVALAKPGLGDESFVQPAPGGAYIAYPKVPEGEVQDTTPSASQVSFLSVNAGTVGASHDRGSGYRPLHGEGSWHPDAVHYALALGGEIRIWNARTDQLNQRGRPSGPYVSAIDYSTDGGRLVIGELSGRLTMLDPTTLTPLGRPAALDDSVVQVSAGPDNHTAIALTGFLDPSGFRVDSATRWALVDLETGTILDDGELGFGGSHVAFSPDGRHAAVSGNGGEVLVLDLDTGEPIRAPASGHKSHVSSLTYSPDGERILTSGLDATVGLWDAETGLLLARVVTPRYPVAAEFREDADRVLIAPLWEGPVYEWNTRVDNAIAYACRVAGRDLTEEEWAEQFGDRPPQRVCTS